MSFRRNYYWVFYRETHTGTLMISKQHKAITTTIVITIITTTILTIVAPTIIIMAIITISSKTTLVTTITTITTTRLVLIIHIALPNPKSIPHPHRFNAWLHLMVLHLLLSLV